MRFDHTLIYLGEFDVKSKYMKASRTNGRGGTIAGIRSSTSVFILRISTSTTGISKYWERILAGWVKIGTNLVASSRDMMQYIPELEPGTLTVIYRGTAPIVATTPCW